MGLVTLQVLDGFEMGQVFEDLATPVSIGRERDNDVALNDEQVSRFHAKIQEADGRLILTDLDSTNGTRVNGRAARLRVLQEGDQVQVGRSLLLVGSPGKVGDLLNGGLRNSDEVESPDAGQMTHAVHPAENAFPNGAPPLPQRLSAVQRVEMHDLLSWIHEELARSLSDAEEADNDEGMFVDVNHWRRLQSLAMTLARQLNDMTNPG
jgi:pSer/pThr/pTyr-binding forkhead associated (FHA) protein